MRRMSQAPPQWSPDGRWWWNGQQWVPAQPPPMNPGPPNGPVNPPTGPVNRRRSVGPWIAVGVVVVVLALIAVSVVGLRNLLLEDERRAAPPSASAERATPRPKPSPSSSPTGPGPVRCRPDSSEACFPKISVAKLVAALRSKGFACEKSGKYGTRCAKRVSGSDQHSYSLGHSLKDADQLNSLMALGSASAVGADPPDRTGQANRRTIEALKAGLGHVLPTAEPTRQQIASWVQQTQGRCADTFDVHKVIDGYQLRCSNPDSIAIAGRDRTVTTWSGSVSINAGWIR